MSSVQACSGPDRGEKESPELILDAGDVACDEWHEKSQLIEDDPEGNVGKVLGNFKPKPAPKP